MSIIKFNPRTTTLIVFIFVIGAIRTYLSADQNMHGLSNFSPIGAMAIFGGVYFNKSWKAFLFPLLTLFLSDIVLQFTVFNKPGNGILYGGWYYVYGAFALMVMVGWLIKKVSIESACLATLAVVFIHWIVTDFGVWINNPKFPQTFIGYLECLMLAVPFEWKFLVGTLAYSAVLFGSFEWMKNRYPVLSMDK